MFTAIVLIEAQRDQIENISQMVADVEGVSEAYTVAGGWDFVVIVRTRKFEDLCRVITHSLVKLPGITKTNTLMAFDCFSKHDLEQMWQIGLDAPEGEE